MTIHHLPGRSVVALDGSPGHTPARPAAAGLAGTWTVDARASDLSFTVRDRVLGRSLHGRFADVEGLIGLDPMTCRTMMLVDAGSLSAGSRSQDHWLRSPAFLDADRCPYIWFRSSGRCPRSGTDAVAVRGDLTVRDVTRVVRCAVTLSSVSAADPDRARFAGLLTFSRSVFGLGTDRDRERGGALVGDRVDVDFDLRVVRRRVAPTDRRAAASVTDHNLPGDES